MSEKWMPRYLVTKAPGVGGEPIPADEPVLVIRAQDELSLLMLDQYLLLYRTFYEHFGTGADWRVIEDLQAHRDELERWQSDNPDSVKKADR
jgi:hypothetical protein